MSSLKAYWLATLYLKNVPPALFLHWLTLFPTIQDLFHAKPNELRAVGFSEQHIVVLREVNWSRVEDDLRWAEEAGQHIITFGETDYPRLLAAIPDPPLALFVRGDKKVLLLPQLAMVGARHASLAGMQVAEYFARELVKVGCAVTSGLARGIDSASHRGALSAKGITLAVMGTGLNHCYPSSNRSLLENIVTQGGAIISEFPLHTLPHAFNFPRRNRIISGLTLGVLIIEAALKSGSLITVRHALSQGREVFAVPGSILQPNARGCHQLIREGAKLVESVTDILDELQALRAVLSPSVTLTTDEQPVLQGPVCAVFDQIDFNVTPTDRIILRSGLTAGEVSSILLLLELRGYIQSVTGGYVRILSSHISK